MGRGLFSVTVKKPKLGPPNVRSTASAVFQAGEWPQDLMVPCVVEYAPCIQAYYTGYRVMDMGGGGRGGEGAADLGCGRTSWRRWWVCGWASIEALVCVVAAASVLAVMICICAHSHVHGCAGHLWGKHKGARVVGVVEGEARP